MTRTEAEVLEIYVLGDGLSLVTNSQQCSLIGDQVVICDPSGLQGLTRLQPLGNTA